MVFAVTPCAPTPNAGLTGTSEISNAPAEPLEPPSNGLHPPPRINGAAHGQPKFGIGHNSGLRIDPGPATDYDKVRGPLAIRKDKLPPETLETFCEAIRSQGNAD